MHANFYTIILACIEMTFFRNSRKTHGDVKAWCLLINIDFNIEVNININIILRLLFYITEAIHDVL